MGKIVNINKSSKKSDGKILLPILIILLVLFIIGSLGETVENEVLESNNKELISGENITVITPNDNSDEYIVSSESVESIEQTKEKEEDNVASENSDNTEEANVNEQVINKIENEDVAEKLKKEELISPEKIREEELNKIPSYSNSPYVVINNNKPFFYETDLVTTSYEKYENLDNLRKMYLYDGFHW